MALFRKESEEKIDTRKMTITTMVGKDTAVEGTISTKSSIRIDGTVIGGVNCAGIVIISKGALIKGNIIAENVIVAGTVEGNTKAADKVNVEPTGEIYGDITSNSLLIDEKSIFQGNCFINRGKEKKGNVVDELIFEKKEPVKTEEKPKPAEAKAVKSPAKETRTANPAPAAYQGAAAQNKVKAPQPKMAKPAELPRTAVKPELKPMPQMEKKQVAGGSAKPAVKDEKAVNRGISSEVKK